MSEVIHKYTHIQSLTGLVSTLVESCPSCPGQVKSPLLMKSLSQQSMNQVGVYDCTSLLCRILYATQWLSSLVKIDVVI